VPFVGADFPTQTTLKLDKQIRGSNLVKIQELPFNEVDLEELLPSDFSFHSFWNDKILSPDFEIERGDSEYTRLLKAEEVLETIHKYHIVYNKGYGYMGLVREKRPLVADATKLQGILDGVEYAKHNTRSVRNDVEELLLLVAPAYHNYLHDLAIKYVIWCTQSLYAQDHRAISINPTGSPERKRELVFHECGHYLESTCPPLGTFTNELLRQKCGQVDKKKLIQVGGGKEFAMPVTNGTADWIKPYAGKWYQRQHPHLPNETEVVSVHLEYFSSKEKLVQLIRHDPNMVRFMAFVIMGGPVAAMDAIQELKRRQALDQIRQRENKSFGYRTRYRGGGGRRSSGSSAKPKNQGFGL
jgi:hypothetical protein